jgi:hypothetical protein
MRWFLEGKKVEDVNFDFDWKDLSMERIIKRGIACHTGDILRSTQEGHSSKIIVNAHLPDVKPADSTLETALGTRSTSTTLSLKLVTGNYILRSATALTVRAESASARAENQHRWLYESDPEECAVTRMAAGREAISASVNSDKQTRREFLTYRP